MQKKIAWLLVWVLMLSFSLAGAEPATEVEGIALTDMAGREVTLDAPAEKVIALSPADAEILYAIGAGDKLVGRGAYVDYPAEVQNVPAVASGAETNLEQIISLAPQVVIMSTMAQTKEQVQMLEDAGIKVVVSDAQTIAGVYEAIEMIGTLVGHEEEAASLVEEMQSAFDVLREDAKDTGKTVYFEVSPLAFGLWTAGNNTFMDEVAALCGVKNLFSDVEGWAEVSQEQVIQRNPDYIVTISMAMPDQPDPAEEIASREGWAEITAVKEGKVLKVTGDTLTRPGPRLVEGAQALFDLVQEESDT